MIDFEHQKPVEWKTLFCGINFLKVLFSFIPRARDHIKKGDRSALRDLRQDLCKDNAARSFRKVLKLSHNENNLSQLMDLNLMRKQRKDCDLNIKVRIEAESSKQPTCKQLGETS